MLPPPGPHSLQDLEALAEGILSSCDTHSSALDQLEEGVSDFEEVCVSLSPEEASKIASEIQRELKVGRGGKGSGGEGGWRIMTVHVYYCRSRVNTRGHVEVCPKARGGHLHR